MFRKDVEDGKVEGVNTQAVLGMSDEEFRVAGTDGASLTLTKADFRRHETRFIVTEEDDDGSTGRPLFDFLRWLIDTMVENEFAFIKWLFENLPKLIAAIAAIFMGGGII